MSLLRAVVVNGPHRCFRHASCFLLHSQKRDKRAWQLPAFVYSERTRPAQAELVKEHAVVLVAENEHQVVGSCLAWLVLDELQVLDLFVSSVHRREGWGRQLLQEVLTRWVKAAIHDQHCHDRLSEVTGPLAQGSQHRHS